MTDITDIERAAQDVAGQWIALSGAQRRVVNEHAGHGLYKALHALGVTMEAAAADREYLSEPEVDPEPEGYPAEKRVADLERMLDVRSDRREALHHARKSWQVITETPQELADQIITIAQTFERYLTGVPDQTLPGGPVGTDAGRHAVLNAAMTWVEVAHLANRSGLENWRNWADDHDVTLINAVLRYRGMPPIESEKP